MIALFGFIHPKGIPALTKWWGLCCHMILRAMREVSYAIGRASHARQVKGDDPDKKGYPGTPSWEFGVGLTTPPRHEKKFFFTIVELRKKLDRLNDDGRKET